MSDQKVKPRVERINGQQIGVGTLDEFAQEVFGEPLADILVVPLRLRLVIKKFRTAGLKWYRLVWVGRNVGWLAAEDTERYGRRRDAVAAGRKLEIDLGVYFDEPG